MLAALKKEVCQANLKLAQEGLALQTWGNASGLDRARGLMVIKPSGIPYHKLKPEQMVVVSLASGEAVEGKLRPSSDTATHLEIYRAFASVNGIVHSHSLYATAWAQAGRPIPPLGTTHADHWHGEVPVTRPLRPVEIKKNYEANTGRVIIEKFKGLDPLRFPAVLVANHGPFAWGKTIIDAIDNAVVLEFVARLASETLFINPSAEAIQAELLNLHFLRKNGPSPCYGQPKE